MNHILINVNLLGMVILIFFMAFSVYVAYFVRLRGLVPLWQFHKDYFSEYTQWLNGQVVNW
jgi:hypothetical protein